MKNKKLIHLIEEEGNTLSRTNEAQHPPIHIFPLVFRGLSLETLPWVCRQNFSPVYFVLMLGTLSLGGLKLLGVALLDLN